MPKIRQREEIKVTEKYTQESEWRKVGRVEQVGGRKVKLGRQEQQGAS